MRARSVRVSSTPQENSCKLPKVLVFDRPFVVLLVDRRTGAILFAAVVYEPGMTGVDHSPKTWW